MKQIIKQHPLKPINLSFEENRQPPAFEVEALKKYKEAHDETWKLKIRYESHKGHLMLLNDEIDDLYFGAFPLEQQLDIFEDALGIGKPADLPPFDSEINIDIGLFFDNTIKHNLALQRLHAQVDEAAARYNEAVADLYEENYLIDPAYFDILHEVYSRYEEVEVDIVSLDEDHQHFLEAYGEVEKLREEYMDLGEAVFNAYSKLHDESESIYRRAEIVHERLDAMS